MRSDLSRRHFLELCAAAAGATLVGCSAQEAGPDADLTATANADGSLSLPSSAAPKAGQAVAFNFSADEPGLLLADKAGSLSALSAKCTHSGCTVAWEGKPGKELHCPCHDSVFNKVGIVQSGPAKKPLPRYSVEKSGENLVLKRI